MAPKASATRSHTLPSKNIKQLFILSSGEDKAEDCIDGIRQEMGEEAAKKVTWLQCDLSQWEKVTEVAKTIMDKAERLDILVNNAGRGIMTRSLDEHGVDRHISLNHLEHATLVGHLLPLLKKTAAAGHTVRISNQASNAHQSAPSSVEFKDLEELNQDLGPNAQVRGPSLFWRAVNG